MKYDNRGSCIVSNLQENKTCKGHQDAVVFSLTETEPLAPWVASFIPLVATIVCCCDRIKTLHFRAWLTNRAKCLAINQVIRAKSYNSCLIFISKKPFYYYVVPCLTFSSSHTLLFGPTNAYASVPSLVLEQKPSSLLSLLSSLLHISKNAD